MGADESREGEQTTKKQKKGKKAPGSDASDSAYSEDGESDDSSDTVGLQGNTEIGLPPPPHLQQRAHPVDDFATQPKVMRKPKLRLIQEGCGLCGVDHGPGECMMTHSSQNLRDYRETLILHTDDEPWLLRVSVSD